MSEGQEVRSAADFAALNAVSTDQVDGSEQVLTDSAALSLEERMREAVQQGEEATTEDFPVPGWGSYTWVRLKVIGHATQRRIVVQNRRDRLNADLYVAADTLLAATDGFYEVGPNEELRPVDTSWLRLAQGVYDVGDVTPRVALIRIIGDERVVQFYGEYVDWMNNERIRVREDVNGDFPRTR